MQMTAMAAGTKLRGGKMITRYLNNRWWKMKESPDGQYVAYHEHEAAIEKLRYENEKLWERIAQQVEENTKLLESKADWCDKATDLHYENIQLRKGMEIIRKTLLLSTIMVSLGLAYVWWGIWH